MLQGVAEKYLGYAMTKISECDAVQTLLRLAHAIALALVLQVVILTYVAYRLSL